MQHKNCKNSIKTTEHKYDKITKMEDKMPWTVQLECLFYSVFAQCFWRFSVPICSTQYMRDIQYGICTNVKQLEFVLKEFLMSCHLNVLQILLSKVTYEVEKFSVKGLSHTCSHGHGRHKKQSCSEEEWGQ